MWQSNSVHVIHMDTCLILGDVYRDISCILYFSVYVSHEFGMRKMRETAGGWSIFRGNIPENIQEPYSKQLPLSPCLVVACDEISPCHLKMDVNNILTQLANWNPTLTCQFSQGSPYMIDLPCACLIAMLNNQRIYRMPWWFCDVSKFVWDGSIKDLLDPVGNASFLSPSVKQPHTYGKSHFFIIFQGKLTNFRLGHKLNSKLSQITRGYA